MCFGYHRLWIYSLVEGQIAVSLDPKPNTKIADVRVMMKQTIALKNRLVCLLKID